MKGGFVEEYKKNHGWNFNSGNLIIMERQKDIKIKISSMPERKIAY